MGKILARWIPLALTISCLCGLLYVTVQQVLRQSANDPQIQVAEDTAAALDNHQNIVISNNKIDLTKSLSPFTMIFDKNGKMTSSEAELDGQIPVIPSGAFDYVAQNGEDRLTWQPEAGVRIAAVITKYNNGYVVVGRSLREVEKQENGLFREVLLGWVGTLVVSFLGAVVFFSKK